MFGERKIFDLPIERVVASFGVQTDRERDLDRYIEIQELIAILFDDLDLQIGGCEKILRKNKLIGWFALDNKSGLRIDRDAFVQSYFKNQLSFLSSRKISRTDRCIDYETVLFLLSKDNQAGQKYDQNSKSVFSHEHS